LIGSIETQAEYRNATSILARNISLANFPIRSNLNRGRQTSPSRRRAGMAWKAPKIVEVPVGMEINMYACAARK
jgi:coenzyme PQQ precursor peptide PqqA